MSLELIFLIIKQNSVPIWSTLREQMTVGRSFGYHMQLRSYSQIYIKLFPRTYCDLSSP